MSTSTNKNPFEDLRQALRTLGVTSPFGVPDQSKIDQMVEGVIAKIRQEKKEQTRQQVRTLINRTLAAGLISALDAYFVMLMLGAWHSQSSVHTYGYLLIWPTLLVLRVVYSAITWKPARKMRP